MIHYERWMAIPAISVALVALIALALALKKPPNRYEHVGLRVGILAAGLIFCYIAFIYGLTDYRKAQFVPLLSKLFAAGSALLGLALIWNAITASTSGLRHLLEKTRLRQAK